MKFRKDQCRYEIIPLNRDAVAEIVGALLLTAVIAVAIGMLALIVFSGSSYVETPALRVSTVDGYGNIDLIHQGGDTLSRDTTQILVDGVDRTDDFETPEGDPWITFSVGDILESSLPCTEGTVIQIISTDSRNPTVIESLTCGPGIPAPVANFTFTPASGYAPLEVSFEDLSTGDPTFWSWDFGDNTSSTSKNPPVHTYNNSSTYPVTLTVCNEGGCNSITINVTVFGFSDFVTNESVFVYGNQVSFSGTDVIGTGSTVIITGDLDNYDLNGGAYIAVSEIYIDGDVYLNGGSASLGSSSEPGNISINGSLTLWSGGRDIYGDVYVNGDFSLKDARIHGDVYVDGNLTLGWTPTLDTDSYIYYTGSISYPNNYYQSILAKCIHQTNVPQVVMPAISIPQARSAYWYTSRGYASSGTLTSNIKIFAGSYTSTDDVPTAENVIIVAETGDIIITHVGGWENQPGSGSGLTGILFAPNGKVTFSGGYFEGVVIAKEGLDVTSGGTNVVFKNIAYYISDPEDYPFEN